VGGDAKVVARGQPDGGQARAGPGSPRGAQRRCRWWRPAEALVELEVWHGL